MSTVPSAAPAPHPEIATDLQQLRPIEKTVFVDEFNPATGEVTSTRMDPDGTSGLSLNTGNQELDITELITAFEGIASEMATSLGAPALRSPSETDGTTAAAPSEEVPALISAPEPAAAPSGSGPRAPTDRDLDHARDVLNNPEKVKNILKEFGRQPEGFSSFMEAVREDPNIKRKAMSVARKTQIREQLNDLPNRKKKSLKKQAERMKNAEMREALAGSTVPCVMITPSRSFKASLIARDYATSASYTGWITTLLPSGLTLFYNPKDPCKNRLGTRILGSKVGNQAILLKLDAEGQLLELTLAEVGKHYTS